MIKLFVLAIAISATTEFLQIESAFKGVELDATFIVLLLFSFVFLIAYSLSRPFHLGSRLLMVGISIAFAVGSLLMAIFADVVFIRGDAVRIAYWRGCSDSPGRPAVCYAEDTHRGYFRILVFDPTGNITRAAEERSEEWVKGVEAGAMGGTLGVCDNKGVALAPFVYEVDCSE